MSHLRSAQNDAHSKPKVKQSVSYAKQIQPRFPAKIKGKRYKSTKGQLHKHRIDRPMKCQWLTRRQSDKITEITGEARRTANTNDNKNFDGKLHNENSINQNANSPSSLQYQCFKIKLGSFKSREHINEKGGGPYRGFGYLSLFSDPIVLARYSQRK